MAAPVLVSARPGVRFAPAAAASFQRADAAWLSRIGGLIPVSSAYRDYDLQLRMFQAWQRYLRGGPKPPHSRAIHPDESMHCRGLAVDTPAWSAPGFIGLMAECGWIRTAAWDPTERHHFEYQAHRDRHRTEPAGDTVTPINNGDDDMTEDEHKMLKEANENAFEARKSASAALTQVNAIYAALFTEQPTSRGSSAGVLSVLGKLEGPVIATRDALFLQSETSFGTPGGVLATLRKVTDKLGITTP